MHLIIRPASGQPVLLSVAIFLLAAACSISAADRAPANASKPNIIYILCDDLGYGDVHCLNPKRGKIATPNFDRLASEGMTFTDAHAGSSVCTPTRYGVLTGRYAWRTRLQHGVLDNYVTPLIAPDRLTVAALLKQHNYQTACIGKWHLGFTLDSKASAPAKGKKESAPMGAQTLDGPETRGFDKFYGFHHARMMKSVFDGNRVSEIVDPIDMLPGITRHATEYISQQAKGGQPFFLYFALNSPHTPIVPSKKWQGKSGLGDYGDFVMETDWAVGEVLSALDKAGISGNTLIIVTSDNGCSPAAGVEKLEKNGHYPSAEFRGYKADIWEGGHRVPFLARWPGTTAPGSKCNQLICLTDLMATCAEIVGAKIPDNAGEDSVSILPLLRGKEKAVRDAVVHHSISGRFAIRQEQWKLELCPGSGGWGNPNDSKAAKSGLPELQLYDMNNDIEETKNLQPEHPEVVSKLSKLLENYIENGRSTPGEKQSNDVKIEIRKPNNKTEKE